MRGVIDEPARLAVVGAAARDRAGVVGTLGAIAFCWFSKAPANCSPANRPKDMAPIRGR
jgi:hypothetical protein